MEARDILIRPIITEKTTALMGEGLSLIHI